MRNFQLNNKRQQSGAALVIGLIILLVMTLLGVSSMNSSRTELKIAANIQNKSVAFQTAETATQRVIVNPATKWGNILTTQTFSYAPSGENFSASTNMKFIDCRNNPEGYSLEGDGVADGSGSGNRAVIHQLRSVGSKNASGNVVASSAIVAGIQTMLAGCTPPAPAP
jgi:type IV pilus assembly PilX-like protein